MANTLKFIIIPFFIATSICTTISAATQIGGPTQMTSGGDGTICVLNTGLLSTTPKTGEEQGTSNNYNCIISTENDSFIISKIERTSLYNDKNEFIGYGPTPSNIELINAVKDIAGNSFILGKNSKTVQENDVALGNDSKTTAVVATSSSTVAGNTYNHAGNNPTSAVSVGDTGKERVIQSVAAGQVSADSTDAVNGSQLYAAYDAINSMYQRQMAGYDSEIKQINHNIDDLKEGAYAGIAGALAVGNLPQPSAPGKNMISGGMGTYKGHSAAAFGFSSLSENEKVIWKMGASFDSNKNSGGAVSFGYQW